MRQKMTLEIMPIPLTQGLFALVDGKDFEQLSKYKWYATKAQNTYRAIRHTSSKLGKRKTIYMHREILNAPPEVDVDHRNHCGLDNRNTNIRICTRSQNNQNQEAMRGETSKYKGVYWHKKAQKWHSQIKYNKKKIYLGLFNNEIKAAIAYDNKAKELFGEFAKTNF